MGQVTQDGATPPAEAVEAAMSRHSHWGLSSSDQKPIQCICGQLLGSTADWRHHQAAAVVAALRLPERDRETAAKAWDEGHTTRWRRDPDDGCTCGAWASIECACGRYGSGELLSLNDNPYRVSALREGRES